MRLAAQSFVLGQAERAVRDTIVSLASARAGERLWRKDASLWKDDPALAPSIRERLGWLDAPGAMQARVAEFLAVAKEARRDGIERAILLGMGGSSLCPEVLHTTFGSRPGWPTLTVLDSTDPGWVIAAGRACDPARTLHVVASKSGTTIEVASFYRHFAARAGAALGGGWARRFVAITDPASPLARLATEAGFRRTILNPPDIGGRYSALSAFGLVPAALIGLDPGTLLSHALGMVRACGPEVPVVENPGIVLGAAIGALARAGRDKLTFVLSPSLSSLGLWIEQLVAESTGKNGRGILPVEGEPLGAPGAYGADRVFVSIRLEGEAEAPAGEASLAALEAAGHPVVRIVLPDRLAIAGEFFRWEVATAIAGSILAVNPFDEPNVKESKERTAERLDAFERVGGIVEAAPLWAEGEMRLDADEETARAIGRAPPSLAHCLARHLERARPGDYVAVMAYLNATEPIASAVGAARARLRDVLGVATTLGWGPRFLHSTGQYHKGGPAAGLFLQITADPPQDVPIPGEPYSFGVLQRAQAIGDFDALARRGRRIVRVHLGRDVAGGLAALARALADLPPRPT